MSFRYKLLIFAGTVRVLGLFRAIKHQYNSNHGHATHKIRPFGYKYPLYLRSNTSDYNTFFQVITSKGYKLPVSIEPTTIIDCGANIGLTTVYYKNLYPNSQIIAIEPEKSNYDLLTKNTDKFDNVTCIQRGIWNKSCYLKIKNESAEKWAFQLEETDEKTDISALSITDIIKQYNLKKIDVLKIDIEGTEKQIFMNGYEEWLPLVKVLMIELHDNCTSGCSMALFSALNGFNFSVDFQGETLIIIFNH